MFDLAIFDFDGTLANTEKVIVNTMQATFAKMGLPALSEAQCRTVIGLRLEDQPAVLFPGRNVDGDQFAAVYREEFHVPNVPGAVQLFPGVMQGLKKIKEAGVILAVGSSRNHESLDAYISDLGLASLVSLTIGGDDVTHGKPAPEMALKILDYFSIPASQAVMTGDMKYDVLAGLSAGTLTIGVTWGNGTYQQLQEAGADHIVNHFDQIPPIILAGR